MARIKKVTGREVLDSRGYPTVAADVVLDDGSTGTAMVPSGASTGSHEALELRDGGARYNGKGVLKAVANVGKIAKRVCGMDAHDMDGTENKSKLGANAMLAVSMAVLRAGAQSAGKPLYEHIRDCYGLKSKQYILPTPMLNIVNGGKHADSGLDVQEFMIVPAKAKTFSEALQWAAETYHVLKDILKKAGQVIAVGDEGGFAPKIAKHEDVLKTLVAACKKAKHASMSLAMDCAASEFYKKGKYHFEKKDYTAEQMTKIYEGWCKKFPIVSIEDPLQEDDWTGWKHITEKLGKKITPFGAILTASVLSSAVSCNQTLAIMLTHQLCGQIEMSPKERAVSLENSAVVIAPLIPWSIAGAVPLASVGAPLSSIALAFYWYLIPIWYFFRGSKIRKIK